MMAMDLTTAPPLAARLAYGSRLYRWTLPHRAPRHLAQAPADLWPGDPEIGRAIVEADHSDPIEDGTAMPRTGRALWFPLGLSDDEIGALHGFSWLRHLKALGSDRGRRTARLRVLDWIRTAGSWHAVSWRPDVLADRIGAWIGFHDLFCSSADDQTRARIYQSLSAQLGHLARVAPRTPVAARLTVARGLILGSLALDRKDRLGSAVNLLEDALEDLLLADGMPGSRRPGDALRMLCQLTDVRQALVSASQLVPDRVQGAIDRLAPAIRFFRHGCGHLGLFNGSGSGHALQIDQILNIAGARGQPMQRLVHGGFERLSAGRSVVILDAGRPARTPLDLGAHAGLGSFEFSSGRCRLIVNCGHHDRHDGLNEALRATAAHSALVVDDTHAATLTKAGGLAPRRGRLEVSRHRADGGCGVSLLHDAWRESHDVTHQRRIFLSTDGADLRGEDLVAGAQDRPLAIRFHLHPDVSVALSRDAGLVHLRTGDGRQGWQFEASGAELSLEPSVICEDGHTTRRSQHILLTATSSAETTIRWALRRVA